MPGTSNRPDSGTPKTDMNMWRETEREVTMSQSALHPGWCQELQVTGHSAIAKALSNVNQLTMCHNQRAVEHIHSTNCCSLRDTSLPELRAQAPSYEPVGTSRTVICSTNCCSLRDTSKEPIVEKLRRILNIFGRAA